MRREGEGGGGKEVERVWGGCGKEVGRCGEAGCGEDAGRTR